MLPTSLGLMLPEFGPHERHVAIGAWAATGGIAAAAGPPLGGLLVQADWRLVFLVNVPVGLLGLGFGLRTARRAPRARAPLRPDLLGARGADRRDRRARRRDRQGPGMGLGLGRGDRAAGRRPRVLLPAIWRRSERHAAPIVEPAMLRVRSFGLAVGASRAVLRRLRRDAARAACCSSPASGTRTCSRPG